MAYAEDGTHGGRCTDAAALAASRAAAVANGAAATVALPRGALAIRCYEARQACCTVGRAVAHMSERQAKGSAKRASAPGPCCFVTTASIEFKRSEQQSQLSEQTLPAPPFCGPVVSLSARTPASATLCSVTSTVRALYAPTAMQACL